MSGTSRRSADLVVLGAGPAGLATALSAAGRGLTVEVLEAAPVVGGMSASFEVAGIRVDLGSHRLHPSMSGEVRELLDRLLGDDLQERPRNGRIHLAGRWVAFPPSTPDLIRKLPPGFAAGVALDTVTSPLRRTRARQETFADVVRAGLGPTFLREFYGPYAVKLWGLPAEELDAELARRRVSADGAASLLRRLVPGRAAPGRAATGRTFMSPRRGFGQVAETLAAAAVDAGATITTSSPATGIERRGEAWVVRAVGRAGDAELELEAPAVVSTLPVSVAVGLLGREAPPAVSEAAARMEHRGVVLVYLVLDSGRWTAFDAHYLPGPETVVARVSEPRNYRDGDDPDDVTVLCAEVPCDVGDEVWSAADDALGARVAAELTALGLPTEPVDVVTRRLPAVYPRLRPGDIALRDSVDRWWATRPGLLSVGRAGRHVGDNTHHVIEEGLAVGRLVGPGGEVDRSALRELRQRTDGYVVVD